ncbi:hypothetical protein D3OALGA1CA_2158 [Olavius algarvensis associated proteobacterium Delta 3]|nr:hypothetical protein D3OALGA1CA_2158 [Olavius algarvensis associated proteobacterium Delta 3]CAB5161562.1 hypothetical protein D3OALGB2SA_5457 [Olavius algarvensis associated proteobacterium Delta 3]
MTARYQYRHTFILCAIEILGLAGIATFPSLLPLFQSEWALTNTQAGWINAGYYAGYMLSVPLLSGLADKVDARKIVAVGGIIGFLASVGYSLLADGFISALLLRTMSGVSLAGIYMPGLTLVSDHTEGPLQNRFVSFYTAAFGIGAGISYLIAGELNALAGWRWTFAVSSLGPALVIPGVLLFVPPGRRRTADRPASIPAAFVTVWREQRVRAYILGYAAHMWELFSMRSWIVAFLTFSQSLQAHGTVMLRPTQIAFLISLVGLPASIGGNELARIFGRKPVVVTVMLGSGVLAAIFGFAPGLPYTWVCVLAVLYGMTVLGDSAALTAGAVGASPPGCRGATLAVHSTFGFGAAFLGPLVVGVVLDVFGSGRLAWGMGFMTMGAAGVVGAGLMSRRRSRASS